MRRLTRLVARREGMRQLTEREVEARRARQLTGAASRYSDDRGRDGELGQE